MGKFEHFGRCLDACDSFAERRLLAALIVSEEFSFAPTPEGPGIAIDAGGIVLHQGLELLRYRVDFALTHETSPMRLVVEVDGFEFHERAPCAAERDRARDRELLAAGWPVARFLGREVTRAPLSCALEMMRLFRSLMGPGLAKTLRSETHALAAHERRETLADDGHPLRERFAVLRP